MMLELDQAFGVWMVRWILSMEAAWRRTMLHTGVRSIWLRWSTMHCLYSGDSRISLFKSSVFSSLATTLMLSILLGLPKESSPWKAPFKVSSVIFSIFHLIISFLQLGEDRLDLGELRGNLLLADLLVGKGVGHSLGGEPDNKVHFLDLGPGWEILKGERGHPNGRWEDASGENGQWSVLDDLLNV